MAKKIRDAAKGRFWRGAVRRFARSGLGVRAFCRQEKLTESAFYFWRRELARRDGEMPKPSEASRRGLRLPDFLPVRLTDPPAHGMSITLELLGGCVLRLPEAIAAARLAEIVAALEATCVVARTAP